MKLPTSIRYAVRILFELDRGGGQMPIARISRNTGISPRTVENLHASLSRNGITVGTCGAKGGIALAGPLEDVNLGTLIEILDEGIDFTVCCGERTNECPNQDACPQRAIWRNISARFREVFDDFSLSAIFRHYPRTQAAKE
jgi:Rrf2 family iron-sulfur cluster assembly transcriptional regulator